MSSSSGSAGADQGKLEDAFKALANESDTKYTQVSIGGKTVAKLDNGDFSYAWVKGDGFISVEADNEADAAAIIAALP